jgi:twitching motility two-component system response regulator PilG
LAPDDGTEDENSVSAALPPQAESFRLEGLEVESFDETDMQTGLADAGRLFEDSSFEAAPGFEEADDEFFEIDLSDCTDEIGLDILEETLHLQEFSAAADSSSLIAESAPAPPAAEFAHLSDPLDFEAPGVMEPEEPAELKEEKASQQVLTNAAGEESLPAEDRIADESFIDKTSPVETQSIVCPFCYVPNEAQAIICSSCNIMFSLSDLEMLLAHTDARRDVLEMAIEDLEAEKTSRGLDATGLTILGVAYLNAKNMRKGAACLQEASQMTPNDFVLSSKVNVLTIRLSEIEAQETKQEAAAPPLKALTIMIVDDSPTVRKLISGKLEKCGHMVVTAADGSEALSKIKEVVPDLILLDIMMPQMDGYQVCKLIRSNEPTRDVPVIMISGKDGFFDKVRGRMAGTTGFSTKPFGPETLMRTIETYVV